METKIRWSSWVLKAPFFSAVTALSIFCFGASLKAQQNAPEMPMQARYEDGAEFRWLNQTVLESRLLDSVEDLSAWSFTGAGEMTLTEVRAKDGRHSLRIRSTSNVAQVDGSGEWEDLVAARKFTGEDWSRYNRISLWVYPDVVGALPVGIETKGFYDAPYWPTQICWTYKEVWTQPVGQWIWLMQDVSVPATVRGTANPGSHEPVEFREQKNGQVTTTTASPLGGEFNLHLPAGHYDVRQGSAHTSVTVLPGGLYDVDLRRDRVLDFKVTFQDLGHQEAVVRVSAEGAGCHKFTIRSDNLTLKEQEKQEIDLTSGIVREAVWHVHVVAPETPWVALVIPDGNLGERREVTGADIPHP